MESRYNQYDPKIYEVKYVIKDISIIKQLENIDMIIFSEKF